MRIIVATRIRHSRTVIIGDVGYYWCRQSWTGVNVRLRIKKWRNLESRINRLKRDYNGGSRDLNEYWDAMMHIVRSVYTCNYAKL